MATQTSRLKFDGSTREARAFPISSRFRLGAAILRSSIVIFSPAKRGRVGRVRRIFRVWRANSIRNPEPHRSKARQRPKAGLAVTSRLTPERGRNSGRARARRARNKNLPEHEILECPQLFGVNGAKARLPLRGRLDGQSATNDGSLGGPMDAELLHAGFQSCGFQPQNLRSTAATANAPTSHL